MWNIRIEIIWFMIDLLIVFGDIDGQRQSFSRMELANIFKLDGTSKKKPKRKHSGWSLFIKCWDMLRCMYNSKLLKTETPSLEKRCLGYDQQVNGFSSTTLSWLSRPLRFSADLHQLKGRDGSADQEINQTLATKLSMNHIMKLDSKYVLKLQYRICMNMLHKSYM